MPEEPISVDTLLEQQSRVRVTVEPVPGSDEEIRVTPLPREGGCACDRSLVIPKREIEGVFSTGEVRNCCGKRLQVAEALFASDTLASVFQQLNAWTSKTRSPTARATAVRPARYAVVDPPVVGRRPGLPSRAFPRASALPMPIMYEFDDWYVRCSDYYDECVAGCSGVEDPACGFECTKNYNRCVAEGLDRLPW
ncbi:hypothetical protein [Streptomyces griseosporeus]|uniref:hypothetical protein n=1 Tax=Streptomyces griseosporeus TaxID=1910 RepID=UPI00167E3FAC|nr:hypothetical protein [Streptomyces griseosporeus]GHF36013.1 hypothetical protein GCM10018783_00310 [Streptomyces griseosporeus]